MKSNYLLLALLAINVLHAAKREPLDTTTVAKKQPVSQQAILQEKIIFVPVSALTPETAITANQQTKLFLTFMAIAGTFGKILLDPSNSYSVIEGVTNMIENVLYAADITSRSTNGNSDNKGFIESLAKYIQQEAQLLLNGQQEEKVTGVQEKSAKEKLMDYALEQGTESK